MNLLLKAIYDATKFAVYHGTRFYYREVLVVGQENLRHRGPQIIVSNHPCTLLDPLNTVVLAKERVFFLVNYSMFKNPIVGAIFRTFYCIPIKRKEDVAEGEKVDNTTYFDQCNKFLKGGGSLYIAPEGTSITEWRLRDLKTGTARIALNAMLDNDTDVKIIPVGLQYYHPEKFQGSLRIEAGEPISSRLFLEAFKENPNQAVDLLTNLISEQMQGLLVNAVDTEQNNLLEHLDQKAQAAAPLDLEERYKRTIRNQANTQALFETSPAAYRELLVAAKAEQHDLEQKGINYQLAAGNDRPGAVNILLWLLTLPFSLYGWLMHLLPIGPALLAVAKAKPERCYMATYKFALSFFTVPLFYMLQTLLVWKLVGNIWGAAAYLLTLPLFGVWAHRHAKLGRNMWSWLRRKP